MGQVVVGMVFLIFGWKAKIYRLRKKYDRVREKVDTLDDKQKKLECLRLLDQAEPNLAMLEEREIVRRERARLYGDVLAVIGRVRIMLTEKGQLPVQRAPTAQQPAQQYPPGYPQR